jgi:membrane protease YdiL (CAAX protease family)
MAAVLLSLPVALLAAGPLRLPMHPCGIIHTPWAPLLSLVVAPFVEEVVLRSGVQRGVVALLLRHDWQLPRAHVVTALLSTCAFALIHLPEWSSEGVLACVPWLVPGAALAVTWIWRCRTRDCIVVHALFNASLWLAGALHP